MQFCSILLLWRVFGMDYLPNFFLIRVEDKQHSKTTNSLLLLTAWLLQCLPTLVALKDRWKVNALKNLLLQVSQQRFLTRVKPEYTLVDRTQIRHLPSYSPGYPLPTEESRARLGWDDPASWLSFTLQCAAPVLLSLESFPSSNQASLDWATAASIFPNMKGKKRSYWWASTRLPPNSEEAWHLPQPASSWAPHNLVTHILSTVVAPHLPYSKLYP